MLGRGAELAAITDAVRRASERREPTPLVFLGERGLGKTALLRDLRDTAAGETLVVPIEIEKGETSAELVDRLVRTIEQMAKSLPKKVGAALETMLSVLPRPTYELPQEAGKLSYDIPDRKDQASQTIDSVFTALADGARRARRALAVTIDEVQNLEPRMLASVARIVHESAQSSNPILLALAGLPEALKLLDALPTYARRWDRYDLRLLTKPETVLAIRGPIVDRGRRIEDEALDALVTESAGYPFFIQKFASAVWAVHRGKIITTHDVEVALPPAKALVEESFYRQPLDTLTARERLFVITLAGLGSGEHALNDIAKKLGAQSPTISSIRYRLIAKRIIATGKNGAVRFLTPLMDRYVRAHETDLITREVRSYAAELRARSANS